MSATSAERTVTLHGHAFSYTDSGIGAGPAVHPRHPRLAEAVGPPRRPARRGPPADRARPVRPRRVREAGRRLLARRPRRHPARPARPARHRAGEPGRPLARRRHRDGVLLPLPRAGRPAGARRQRGPRPRGQPAAAVGDPAGCGVRAAGHRVRLDARPDRLCRSGCSARWGCGRVATSPRSGTASPRSATPTPVARSWRRPGRSSTPAARASTRTTTCPTRRPIPTLVVWGTKDRMIPAWHAASATASIENCRVELFQGAGHFPHLDDPDRFAALVREFVGDPA